ncbi:MAG: ferrous iron transport protein B [Paracoccaceae bacterium]
MGCATCALAGCGACPTAFAGPPEHRVFVLGPPNSGKSTLFNALTGARQSIGNWPGVTVDRKSGLTLCDGLPVEVVDLPGVSSLSSPQAERIDERVTREALLTHRPDALLVAVDLSAPHRALSMLLQAMDCGVPVVAALTKADYWPCPVSQTAAVTLSRELGLPVIAVSGQAHTGLGRLQARLAEVLRTVPPSVPSEQLPAAPQAAAALARMGAEIAAQGAFAGGNAHAAARRLLEGDRLAGELAGPALSALRDDLIAGTGLVSGARLDHALTELHIARAADLARRLDMPPPRSRRALSDRLDRLAVSRVFGLPIFLGVMYLLFFLSINVAGVFIDLFDGLGQAAFVDLPQLLLFKLGLAGSLPEVLVTSVGTGLQTVVTFAPVVGFLFLCQIFLEESGYMTRAAVVADRLMRRLGLSGRAFLPLILGFGCTIPAVLATRTLDTRAERILTAMMAPFMSCGARLPVYALFAAAYFPAGGQNVVFGIYLLGIAAALFTGTMLAPRLALGCPRPLAIELPVYQLPPPLRLLRLTWARLRQFVTDAGRTILVVVAFLSFFNSVGFDGSLGNETNGRSVLAEAARQVTPALSPMGIEAGNWPAAVGLVTGIFAKETVVGTLQALYTASDGGDGAAPDPLATARGALSGLGETVAGLLPALGDPLGLDIGETETHAAAAAAQGVESGLFAALTRNFDGKAGAFAYMVAVLLYIPCAASLSTIWREIGPRWALVSAGWTTLVAYAGSVIAYQAGTGLRHPLSSALWIAGMLGVIAIVFALARYTARSGPDGPGASVIAQ